MCHRSGWLDGKRLPWLAQPARRAGEALGLAKEPQRYYPQCRGCSQRQAAAVRANKRTLVFHFGGPRPWFFAGVLWTMQYRAALSAGMHRDVRAWARGWCPH